jgi:hypothetical protein
MLFNQFLESHLNVAFAQAPAIVGAVLVLAVVIAEPFAIALAGIAAGEEITTTRATNGPPEWEVRVVQLLLYGEAIAAPVTGGHDPQVFLIVEHGHMQSSIPFPAPGIDNFSVIEIEVVVEKAMNELLVCFAPPNLSQSTFIQHLDQFSLVPVALSILAQHRLDNRK